MDSINDILSSLTPDDIDVLKSMADSLFGDSDDRSSDNNNRKNESTGFDGFITSEMLIKLSNIMNMMNSSDSGRYRLIEALKPNLSPRRRQKADEALQLLKILEIVPLLTDLYKSGDNNTKQQP